MKVILLRSDSGRLERVGGRLICSFTNLAPVNINMPAMNCVGRSHDLRRPILLMKTASTMGAQRSLREKGQEQRAKRAWEE